MPGLFDLDGITEAQVTKPRVTSTSTKTRKYRCPTHGDRYHQRKYRMALTAFAW